MAGETRVDVYGQFQIFGQSLELDGDFGADETTLSARFGDVSLGDILTYLVHLAAPERDFKLEAPWDLLNAINLRNLTFEFQFGREGRRRIGFRYDSLGVDLKFVRISAVEIWHVLGGDKQVDISLYGWFLGQDFTQHPLTWDVLNQPPPAVPGPGVKTFDLEYLGLGQRVTLKDRQALSTLASVIDALEEASSAKALPPAANPLKSLEKLKFDSSAGWLIGTKFSVLNTVALSAVFNDPNLYGLLISLSGERAGTLAGLSFEILYRKIADNLGLYHIELKLPDVMRHLEFGEVSVTLPIIDIDIYTNGNFLIDLGFPRNLDFSKSFALEVFPFVGMGGFYFGVLDSQTSTDVPAVINGDFSPVLAFGLGLQVGVGKTIEAGILSAGVTVGVVGILEGTLAWFHPHSPDVPRETYYKVTGTVAIVGHLFGGVSFAIIKAQVDVFVYAGAQVTFESHEPTDIALIAGVAVSLRVKINLGLFSIHIKLSFHTTIRQSFTIGSHTQAPWVLGPRREPDAEKVEAMAFRTTRKLVHTVGFRRVGEHQLLMNRSFAEVHERGGLTWRGTRLLSGMPDGRVDVDLYFVPMVTLGLPGDRPKPPAAPQDAAGTDEEAAVQLVALLFIESASESNGGGDGGSNASATPAELSPFEQLARCALTWAIETIHQANGKANVGAPDRPVTLSELHYVYEDLTRRKAEQPIGFREVVDFLRENVKFTIKPPPKGSDAESLSKNKNFTVFPMLPFLSLTTSDGQAEVNFATESPCSDRYYQFIDRYFEQIAAKTDAPGANGAAPAAPQQLAAADESRIEISMAACIFTDYFLTVMRQVVHDAIKHFENYVYSASEGDTLDEIARRFGHGDDQAVDRIARANRSSLGFFWKSADGDSDPPNRLRIVSFSAPLRSNDSLRTFAERHGRLPLAVGLKVKDQPGLLAMDATLAVPGGMYTITKDDTIENVAARFYTDEPSLRAANPDFDWTPRPWQSTSLPVGARINLPATSYRIQQGDTLQSIADHYGVDVTEIVNLAENLKSTTLLAPHATLDFGLRAHVAHGESMSDLVQRFGCDLEPVDVFKRVKDQRDLLATDAVVAVVGGSYTIQPGDTLRSIAARCLPADAEHPMAPVQTLIDLNGELADWTPPEGSGEALPVGETLKLPDVEYAVQDGDTLSSIAERFGLTVEGLLNSGDNLSRKSLLIPLAPVALPPMTYVIGADDTLESIARRFDLTVEQLALSNPGPLTRFGKILIPDCEVLPLDELVRQLAVSKTFDRASGMVARFLLHGLRLPDPADLPDPEELETAAPDISGLDLYPLYVLTGQQWPAPTSDPLSGYSATLALNPQSSSGGGSRRSRNGGSGGASSRTDGITPPSISFASDHPDESMVVPLDEIGSTLKEFRGQIKGIADLLGGGLVVTRLPPYSVVSRRFALGKPVAWTAPQAPAFDGDPSEQATGAPKLYPLPAGVRALVADSLAGSMELRLAQGTRTRTGHSVMRTTPVKGFGWATRLDFQIRRAADPARPQGFIPFLYEVYSTDEEGRHTLLELIEHLDGRAGVWAQIDILYEADSTNTGGSALRSDVLDPSSVLLLKANLSTLTHSPPAPVLMVREEAEAPVAPTEILTDATLSTEDAVNFLKLLWECSVVNTGGYYLFYRAGESDAEGLPERLFNQKSTGTITVLITVRPTEANATIAAHPFHNCVICTENTAADAVVFVEAPDIPVDAGMTLTDVARKMPGVTDGNLSQAVRRLGEANAGVPNLIQPGTAIALPNGKSYTVRLGDDLLSVAAATGTALQAVIEAIKDLKPALVGRARMYVDPAWVWQHNVLAPGNAGFRVYRPDPDPDPSDQQAQEDPRRRVQALFNLLGYWLSGTGELSRSAEGLPVGPANGAPDEGDGAALTVPATNPLPAAHAGPAPWIYRRVLSVLDWAKGRDALPAGDDVAGVDPYLGLGESAELALQFHDIFGNRCLPDSSATKLDQQILYRDPLTRLGQWPSAAATYDFSGATPAELEFALEFDFARYVPPSAAAFGSAVVSTRGVEVPIATARRARADRARYAQIFFQLRQPDVTCHLETSVDGGRPHALDKGPLLAFAAAGCAYLDVVGAMRVVSVRIERGNTLQRIAAPYRISAAQLALANQNTPGLLQAGAAMMVPRRYVVVQNDSLDSIAHRAKVEGLTPAIVAVDNSAAELTAGTSITLRSKDYVVQPGDTLASVARRRRIPVDELAEQNATVPNLFAAGTQLDLGHTLTIIEEGGTFATIAAATGSSVALLAETNRDSAMLSEGQPIIVPNHLMIDTATRSVYSVKANDTFDKIASKHGISRTALAIANQYVDGLLAAKDPNAAISYRDKRVAIESNDNLVTVLARVRQACGDGTISLNDIVAANRGNLRVLAPGARMLIPPPATNQRFTISPDFPDDPLFPLTVTVGLVRDEELVDPAFHDVVEVRQVDSAIRPNLETANGDVASEGDGETLGLKGFARRFESSFPGLKLATGFKSGASDWGQDMNRLFALQFQNEKLSYRIRNTPSFFAPRPLSPDDSAAVAWSADDVEIRPYRSGEGLGEPGKQNFDAIDLDGWARDFLSTVDLFLSPEYAVAAFRLDAASYRSVVQAKKTMAEAIRESVTPIIAPTDDEDGAFDLEAAKEALHQRLLIQLSEAYRVDTVVQFPVDVTSPYTDPNTTAPRLSGRPFGGYAIPGGATLGSVANDLSVPLRLLAAFIASKRHILAAGSVFKFQGKEHSVTPDDTLKTVASALSTTVQGLAAANSTAQSLLLTGAPLGLSRRIYQIDQADTIATVIERLDPDLADPRSSEAIENFAAMNEQVALFTGGVKIDGYTTKENDRLGEAARQLGIDPSQLVAMVFDRPQLLLPGSRVSLLTRLPGFTMSEAKLSLADAKYPSADSTLTFLFYSASNTAHRSVRTNIVYKINELEYDIREAGFAAGYESSDWLAFVLPVEDHGIGDVDIPIPLRAYPALPSMESQGVRFHLEEDPAAGRAMSHGDAPSQPLLQEIKTYDYHYTYSYRPAAQDEVYASVRYNVEADGGSDAAITAGKEGSDLPACLAQYATIAPQLKEDLSALTALDPEDNPPAVEATAKVAVSVVATLAQQIAAAWRAWRPVARLEPLQLRYRVRHQSAADGKAHVHVLPASAAARARVAAPRVRLPDHELESRSEGGDHRVYSFLRSPEAMEPTVRRSSKLQRAKIEFPGQDVIVQQNVWGSVSVTRNETLLAGRKTNDPFVYRLKDVHFSDPARPLFTYRRPYDIGTSPPLSEDTRAPTLANRLINFFADLLDLTPDSPPEDARNVRVAVSFGFVLAGDGKGKPGDSSAEDPDESMIAAVPVLLVPARPFDPAKDLTAASGMCAQLAAAMNGWLDRHNPARERAMWMFDVSVYSTVGGAADSDRAVPLLQLPDLCLRLEDAR